ncbi:uncharacterized protein LOC144448442 [Glandiceps talaboti]
MFEVPNMFLQRYCPTDTTQNLHVPYEEFDVADDRIKGMIDWEIANQTKRDKLKVYQELGLPLDPRHWTVHQAATWFHWLSETCSLDNTFSEEIIEQRLSGSILSQMTEQDFRETFYAQGDNVDVSYRYLQYWTRVDSLPADKTNYPPKTKAEMLRRYCETRIQRTKPLPCSQPYNDTSIIHRVDREPWRGSFQPVVTRTCTEPIGCQAHLENTRNNTYIKQELVTEEEPKPLDLSKTANRSTENKQSPVSSALTITPNLMISSQHVSSAVTATTTLTKSNQYFPPVVIATPNASSLQTMPSSMADMRHVPSTVPMIPSAMGTRYILPTVKVNSSTANTRYAASAVSTIPNIMAETNQYVLPVSTATSKMAVMKQEHTAPPTPCRFSSLVAAQNATQENCFPKGHDNMNTVKTTQVYKNTHSLIAEVQHRTVPKTQEAAFPGPLVISAFQEQKADMPSKALSCEKSSSSTPPEVPVSRDSVPSTTIPVQPIKRKRGRPPKPKPPGFEKKKRIQPILWRFLLASLDDPEMSKGVVWVKREEGLFKFISNHKDIVARRWGQMKGNKMEMTYSKMARALRHYGKKGIFMESRRRLHYKINPNYIQKYANGKKSGEKK